MYAHRHHHFNMFPAVQRCQRGILQGTIRTMNRTEVYSYSKAALGSKSAFPNRRWISSTPSNRLASKGAGTPFDAPFLMASQSGLSESQLDVREAIRQLTSQFSNDYWRDCDKESRCE